ncbi:MAG: phosphoglycerate kinase [Candidatus Firestonebacteria bacterium]|nr:phosphoglycerate kinase [Candidatus Firestonebacteria bacterium]
MDKLSITDVKLNNKHVLMRVDFNVPMDESGNITDDSRISQTLPSIKYALENDAKLILCTHIGRPKGVPDPRLKTDVVAKRLSELINRPVKKLDNCVGLEVENEIKNMQNGDIIFLENVRFYKEETSNDERFSRQLAKIADVYINDAFATAHRAHCSTASVARYVPVAAAGFLMQKEIDYFVKLLENPKRPFLAILGGAKVSGKIGAIQNLMHKVDAFLIGGGMAYTFLKAMGSHVGNSLVELDKIEIAKDTLRDSIDHTVEMLLPIDHVIGDKFSADANIKIVTRGNIPDEWEAMDIGPKTIEMFSGYISRAATIIWNGPMGVFEFPNFSRGTFELARLLNESKATTVIGGGDSVAAIMQAGYTKNITHISTGGGASLELLEGKTFPGISFLTDKHH